MNCPKCKYSNPQGAAYCQLCYEVLNRSAAQRYYHALRRERRLQGEQEPVPVTQPASVDRFELSAPTIRIGTLTRPLRDAFGRYILPNSEGLRLAIAVVILLLGVLFYAAPVQRMKIYGSRMDYRIPQRTSLTYLIGFHADIHAHSERGGRLDTPLPSVKMDEMGMVDLRASRPSGKTQNAAIKPREWVRVISAPDGTSNQSIPLSDPSLKPVTVILSRQGYLIKRDATISPRLGRTLPFLMPQWPGGLLRKGDHWEEPVAWLESLKDWKILWKGSLRWSVAGYESHYGTPCVHLIYQAQVIPHIQGTPDWAKNAVRTAAYAGAGRGDALFDVREHQLLANTFIQDGALTLPITDLAHIPTEDRIGRSFHKRLSQRWEAVPGTLVLKISSKLDIRKP